MRAQTATTVENALAELDGVQVSPTDHAWLEDIRTLARAELFHRFEMRDREESALAQFWRRQALLFEPNHAFYFGFLDYQEQLKPRYETERRI